MKLLFETSSEKQKEAARAWIDPTVTDIVYGGAKGCFSAGTLIKTSKGYVSIEKIHAGDCVLSFNKFYEKLEYKKVLKTFTYGGDIPCKMIIFIMHDGTQIKCTDNHEFYFEGFWQSASRLARRRMELCRRNQQSLSNINERQAIYYKTQKQPQPCNNETGIGQKGVLKNYYCNGREKKEYIYSQISSHYLYSKSKKSPPGKSYRFQSIKQLFREFGVGNKKRKRDPLFKGRTVKRFYQRLQTEEPRQGIEKPQCDINGRTSERNSFKIQAENLYERNVREGVRRGTVDYKGCDLTQMAACEINLYDVTEIQTEYSAELIYDLCVEDNHSYIITEQNIIVHNSGKSYLGCSLIFGNALIYPDTRYFIARKQLIDLRKHTMPTIDLVFKNWGIELAKYGKFNGQDNVYNLYNKSVVLLIEAKEMPSDPMYERFGSMQLTQGFIEEAGEFEINAKTNLSIAVGRWNNDKYGLTGKIIQTCNPKKNYLYKEYYLPWKWGTLTPNKRFIQAFAYENTKNEPGYLENLKRNLKGVERERLLDGNWEYASDANSLIDYDKILDIFSNTGVAHGEKKITSDIARLGGDRIVKIEWDGWRGKVFEIPKGKLNETAASLESSRIRMGIGKSDVIIDSDGMGVGINDFVGYRMFVNNSSPLPDPLQPTDREGKTVLEQYENLKSQCYFRLAERINKNGLYLECESEEQQQLITEELEQVKIKKLDSDGKKGVIEKAKVKETIGRSPDFSDTIMQKEFFELKPKRTWEYA